jgi:hypothetical protein
MTSITRFLVAALVLAVVIGTAEPASAAAPPPAKQQTGKHAKKKHAKKKHAKKKKKKAGRPRATRPAPRPQPRPQPQPQPQPPPQAPATPGGSGQFNVTARGGYRYQYRTDGPSWYAKSEQTLNWLAVGYAYLVPGWTDTDFQISRSFLDGVLDSYTFENSAASTTTDSNGMPVTCARAYIEQPVDSRVTLHLGLAGTKPSDLRVGLGSGYFEVRATQTASGPPSCHPPTVGSWTQTFRFDGLLYSYHPVVTSDGESSCTSSGTLSTGLTRSCTAIVYRGTAASETWTMTVTISPT